VLSRVKILSYREIIREANTGIWWGGEARRRRALAKKEAHLKEGEMARVKSGLAFHCHHDALVEYVYDFDERVKVIKDHKPKEEQELRLRLFKLIPNDLLPGLGSPEWDAHIKAWDAHIKARDAYDKARDAYDKARDAYDKAWDAYDKAWDAHDKARDAYDKVRDAYDKARAEYTGKYKKEFESLHEKLCPDCPWDGSTIFTHRKDTGEWY